MVFASGCPSRNLARAGGGDLRALLTLVVLGLVGFMTIAGLFAPVRAGLERATSVAAGASTQGVGDLLGTYWGLADGAANAIATVVTGCNGPGVLLRQLPLPQVAAACRLRRRGRPCGCGRSGP